MMKTQEQIKRERERDKAKDRKIRVTNVSKQRINIQLRTPRGIDPLIGEQTCSLKMGEGIDIPIGRANIGQLQTTFERILAPFHELKQNNVFMQSSQFVIDNVIDLPSRAWIYDYSGVETEILRSTLFMLSDRQPKFDILEMCQQLANNILSGRVNRNDVIEGNYTLTNKLHQKDYYNLNSIILKRAVGIILILTRMIL